MMLFLYILNFKGHVSAQFYLGLCFHTCSKKNIKKAIYWYKKAAEQVIFP